MNSSILKTVALNWLRFDKKMSYIGTEMGAFSADAFGADTERSIEIEIKISRSDLVNDFRKEKHKIYKADQHEYSQKWIPNYFLFLVPEYLEEAAVEACKEYPAYGVLVYREDHHNSLNYTAMIRSAKRCKRMHSRAPDQSLLLSIAHRMSSELLSAHIIKTGLSEMHTRIKDQIEKLTKHPSVDFADDQDTKESLLEKLNACFCSDIQNHTDHLPECEKCQSIRAELIRRN